MTPSSPKDREAEIRARVEKATDIETLKAWCHWKEREPNLSEDDRDFVKAIRDVISQVGTWKAKYDAQNHQLALRDAEVAKMREALLQISGAKPLDQDRFASASGDFLTAKRILAGGIVTSTTADQDLLYELADLPLAEIRKESK